MSANSGKRKDEEAPIPFPIDGTLDLHHFQPGEVKALVEDYLIECQQHRIYQVRIIHGKGMGILRKTVHSVLRGLSRVSSFQAADEGGGGWGATIVYLKKEKES